MNIQDIEIANTLNEIRKVNEMIDFHKAQIEPSQNSINNYITLRIDLVEQLNDLLFRYHLKFTNKPVEQVELIAA